MKEVRTLYVDSGEDGVRLDRWFKRRWPHLNHIQIQKLARSGQIRVDGGRAKPDTRLAAGSQVRVPPLPEEGPAREKGQLDPREIAYAKSLVLYEDEEVLALNKPAGLAVQGGTKTSKHVDRLLSAWGEGLARPRRQAVMPGGGVYEAPCRHRVRPAGSRRAAGTRPAPSRR